jgi:hypothetical protein
MFLNFELNRERVPLFFTANEITDNLRFFFELKWFFLLSKFLFYFIYMRFLFSDRKLDPT